MAKKVTTEEQATAGSASPENTNGNNTIPENGKVHEIKETIEENGDDKEGKETKIPETPLASSYPPSVEAILKSFPTYESLYIDSHGGIYTPATAPVVRGNATLYKNPFYKS